MKTNLILTIALVLIVQISLNTAEGKKPKNHPNKKDSIKLCPRIKSDKPCKETNKTVITCSSDNECKNGKKCCMDNCRPVKVCTDPISVSKKPKSGNCPVSTFDPLLMCSPVDSAYYECRVDSECKANQKCCSDGPCGVMKCKGPVDMRSGKCPAYKYDYSVIQKCKRFNEKDFECRKDSDCKKPKQKCCKNSCSLLTCQDPFVEPSTKPKPGNCPLNAFDPQIMCSPVDPSAYDCRVDGECPGNKKCCAEGPCAFKTCKDSVDVREGECPKLNLTANQNCKPFNVSNFQCRKDSDCLTKPLQKCCKDSCSLLTCQELVLKPNPPATKPKPGGCPPTTFDPQIMCSPVDPSAYDCRVDGECPSNKKCCADGPCAFKTCKDSVDLKEGECPVHKFNFTLIQNCKPFNESDFKCRQDSDCPSKPLQKCCRDACYLLTCQEPQKKKK